MLTADKNGTFSKPGKYGTLYLHRVEYVDSSDSSIRFEQMLWGYDVEHVLDKFYNDPDDGWRVTKVSRAKALKHREIVHEVSP